VAKEFTLFALRPTHEASGVTNLLGESLLGIVHCDRARIYLSLKRLQWCWAHLKRDFFKRWSTAATAKQSVWIKTGCARRALFRHWAHYRDGTISRAALQRRLAPVRRAMERLLARGLQSGNRSLVGMCRIARAS
jgi:transposase